MSRILLTSDTHCGHAKRMPVARGFSSIQEHDDTLQQRWNKIVRKNDTVIHFGDVGCGCRDSYILDWVSKLNGTIHLITGNHDSPWPGHRTAHTHQRRWLERFETVQAYGTRRVNKQRIVMSHLPYKGDHTETERYAEWRLPNTGDLLLHGHVHDKWLVNQNQINVGVDVWNYAPVPYDDVISLAKELGLL